METAAKNLGLSQNALKVLQKRYLKKDEEGRVVETPEELFRRVSQAIAAADLPYGKSFSQVEQVEEEFYRMMTVLDFLPTGHLPALLTEQGSVAP